MSFTKSGIETAKLINYDARSKGVDDHGFIEIAKNPARYYVHYIRMNRRMDSWIEASKVRLLDSRSRDAILAEEEFYHKKLNEPKEVTGIEKISHREDGTINFIEPEHNEQGMDEASLKEHEEVTKFKNINSIELGRYQMETWYYSPFPKEYYPEGIIDMVYFCEFCLNFYKCKNELLRHQKHCTLRHPPGDEIYRKDGIAMFEVDGAGSYREHIYCQNLSFLAKLFLDHKTLYFDVDPFFYYVMCEYDSRGYHIVGYFSKEKFSEQGYNLACILTIPAHQRKGYGHFLIDFSYALSKKEVKVGSPEKPLSDLGFISFRSYWKKIILRYLAKHNNEEVTIFDICRATSMLPEDIINTLKYLDILKWESLNTSLFRYFNGSHVVSVPLKHLAEVNGIESKKVPEVDLSCIIWTPHIAEEGKNDKYYLSNIECQSETLSFEF